jgi:hypothetical protein
MVGDALEAIRFLAQFGEKISRSQYVQSFDVQDALLSHHDAMVLLAIRNSLVQ